MVFLAEQTIPIPTKDLLSWTFDHVPYDAENPIYIDATKPERSISANQARRIIRKLIAGLQQWGVKPGQKHVVCLHAFNDIMYSMMFLGIIGAGGIFAGTNPGYTQYELIHHIRTSETKYILTEPEMLEPILAAAQECSIPSSNILIFNVLGQAVPEGFESWETLMGRGEADWIRFDDLDTAKNTEVARLFSSGTTGLPKAVMLSHHNFVAQHTLLYENNKKDFNIKRLLCLPLFHAALVPVAHTTALKAGHVSVVMRRFELEPFLANIEKHQINDLIIVPPLVIATIMSPITKKYDLSSIRIARVGAAPLGKGPQARFQRLIGEDAPFTQILGLTEACCIVTMVPYPKNDDTGSVGQPLANVDMKIIDDDGTDITDYNVNGELCIRGPTVTLGYLNNPTANENAFDSEGFYHTGDVGYCERKSKLWYVVDRKKDLIKVRGFQVAPAELEAVLLSHPQIVDAAVLGIETGGVDGQLPRAYVVRRPGQEGDRLTEREVKDFLEGRLAKYKRIEGGVKFVDAIPKNASGKILKRVLREEARRDTRAKL